MKKQPNPEPEQPPAAAAAAAAANSTPPSVSAMSWSMARYGEIGKPYIWAACGPEGFDCSGLVSYCLSGSIRRSPRHHLHVPRVAACEQPPAKGRCVHELLPLRNLRRRWIHGARPHRGSDRMRRARAIRHGVRPLLRDHAGNASSSANLIISTRKTPSFEGVFFYGERSRTYRLGSPPRNKRDYPPRSSSAHENEMHLSLKLALKMTV